MGRAAHLFREEGGAGRRSRFPPARPGGECAHPRSLRDRGRGCLGTSPGAKARFLGPDHYPEAYSQVFDILDVWFDSGSTHAFVLRDRPDGTRGRHRGCLHGRHRPASRVVPLLAAAGLRDDRARALPQRCDPRLHAGREGHEDVQVHRQHRCPRRRSSTSTAPISCGSGWRRPTTPPISGSGRRS